MMVPPLLILEDLEDLAAEVLHMLEHLQVEQEHLVKAILVVLDLQPEILLADLAVGAVLVVLEMLDLALLEVLVEMGQHLLLVDHQ